ncbi:MAG: S41 family peptidase [Bacteroidales bacterium]
MKRIIIVLFCAFCLGSCSAKAQQKNPNSSRIDKEYKTAMTKYNSMLEYIKYYYMDTVNINKISETILKDLMEQLDPHSVYISADEVAKMNEPLEAEFDGIGVQFAIIKDTLTVQNPVAGGPSEKVGIRAGDKIIGVDGEQISGKELTNDKVFKLLRGEKGTKVDLQIWRVPFGRAYKDGEKLDFTVVRDKIPIKSLAASYQAEPGVAYIKLSRFAATTYEEMMNALENLDANKGIIIDLRGNGGGYLGQAMSISNEFLEKDELMLYTTGKNARPMNIKSDGKGHYKKTPLVLLVDGNSASASEIVSGAIQDWDRGIIVGRKTFGKGLVQQQFPLGDGSMIRLTVARYHTPSGRVIQRPYENGNASDYYADFIKRYMDGETFHRDSIHFPDSLKYTTLRTKRTVYGGGGIMPDVFVPQDTTANSMYYSNLLRKGIIPEFVNRYVDKYRTTWKKEYTSFSQFQSNFKISDDFFNGLIDYATKQGVKKVPADIAKSKEDLKLYMKALTAGLVLQDADFYKVMNSGRDKEFKKAIEVINNWNEYSSKMLDTQSVVGTL